MEMTHRHNHGHSNDSSVSDTRGGKHIIETNATSGGEPPSEDSSLQDDQTTRLKRGLKKRQVTMIALGGALGSGLLIASGSALAKAGPGSLLISFTMLGLIVWIVLCSLGEMATWLPIESGFTGFAARFCDPALGFALGYTYWFKYIVITPNQLTACALVLQYWVDGNVVNPGVFIVVFLIAIISINSMGVKCFGEIEFALSSAKVLTMCGLIILSLVLMLGGGPDHDRKGFRYWKDPGAFKPLYATGSTGNFLALWSTLVTAAFAYLGSELVGVTVGEAQNPRKVIPQAIKLTFWRILFFYVFSVFLIGTLVPYNSAKLSFATKQTTGASASPFVVAIIESGIQVLPGFLNACILVFTFSAANSDLYISARVLYGLAKEGHAPKIFAHTDKRGCPIYALGLSSLIACIAFLNVADDSRVVFGYFVSLVTVFGLLTWISILVTYIYWVRARRAQGLGDKDLVYKAPLGLYGAYGALVFCILIVVFSNFGVFVHVPTRDNPTFDYKTFITGYLGLPLYLMMIFGYKFATKTKGHTALEVDLLGGKDIIDREEEVYLAEQAAKNELKDSGWFYGTFVAWLF